MMKMLRSHAGLLSLVCLTNAGLLFSGIGAGQAGQVNPALRKMVPAVESWKLAEAPRSYFPENLYEYIDGAAESYLSYDFRELLVAQFQKTGSEATVTLEIYDMGTGVNAFGIFGAERYPENKAIAAGDSGYLDGESLNFMAGRFYVKLLSYGLAGQTPGVLKDFAEKTAGAVPEKGGLPIYLRCFPKDNLVAQSEKFIKKNFMGYEFLRNGYEATYKFGDQEFEAFLIVADSPQEAETMLSRLMDFLAQDKQIPEKTAQGYRVKNRYGQNLFVSRVGGSLCGAMRVPAGLETAGEKCLKELASSVGKILSPRP